MYSFTNVFLNPYTRAEYNLNCFFRHVSLLYCLFEVFPGDVTCVCSRSPPAPLTFTALFQSCSLRVHLKRAALRLKRAWLLSGEMHFLYLFKSPQRVSSKKKKMDCCPPPPLTYWLIYRSDGAGQIFVLWTRKCLPHGSSDDFLVFNLPDGMITMINISDNILHDNKDDDDVSLTQYHVIREFKCHARQKCCIFK